MPRVEICLQVRAPIQRVWDTVVDIEFYPASMEHVRSVEIVQQNDVHVRQAAWSVVLKGSILEWVEEECLDPEAYAITFRQLTGDLEHFDGKWTLEALSTDETLVIFEVQFEIGIPSLAEMLNPVATRSLQENCVAMLCGIERQATC